MLRWHNPTPSPREHSGGGQKKQTLSEKKYEIVGFSKRLDFSKADCNYHDVRVFEVGSKFMNLERV